MEVLVTPLASCKPSLWCAHKLSVPTKSSNFDSDVSKVSAFTHSTIILSELMRFLRSMPASVNYHPEAHMHFCAHVCLTKRSYSSDLDSTRFFSGQIYPKSLMCWVFETNYRHFPFQQWLLFSHHSNFRELFLHSWAASWTFETGGRTLTWADFDTGFLFSGRNTEVVNLLKLSREVLVSPFPGSKPKNRYTIRRANVWKHQHPLHLLLISHLFLQILSCNQEVPHFPKLSLWGTSNIFLCCNQCSFFLDSWLFGNFHRSPWSPPILNQACALTFRFVFRRHLWGKSMRFHSNTNCVDFL